MANEVTALEYSFWEVTWVATPARMTAGDLGFDGGELVDEDAEGEFSVGGGELVNVVGGVELGALGVLGVGAPDDSPPPPRNAHALTVLSRDPEV